MLERLKELEAKATPAPWDHDASGYIFEAATQKEIDDDQGFKDAALIVEMRNVLPKLLAFVTAWDDCQTVTANRAEKMRVLLSAREALDEVTK